MQPDANEPSTPSQPASTPFTSETPDTMNYAQPPVSDATPATPSFGSETPAQSQPSQPPVTPQVIGLPAEQSYQLDTAPQTGQPTQPVVATFFQPDTVPIQPGMPGAGMPPAPKPRSKKKLVIAGAVILLLLLGSAGAVFGYYLPNRPENVWNTSMERSGEALDSLTTELLDEKKLDSFKQSNIAIDLDASYGEDQYQGSFEAKFDATKLDAGLDISLQAADQPEKTIALKALSELAEGTRYPTIHFQFSGLQSLGLDTYAPQLLPYEGKWITVSSEYLESVFEAYAGLAAETEVPAEPEEEQMTAADISELSQAVLKVTDEYIFTTDPKKSVLERRSFVGKESMDGLNTYHYKVGINRANAIAYCKATINAVFATKAFEKMIPEESEESVQSGKTEALEECDESVKEEIKASDTFDLWVDGKYKLIHKIRFTDENNKQAYFDIGQLYKGGDDLSLFVAYHDGKTDSDAKFTLETNLKTARTKGVFTMTAKEDDVPINVKASLTAQPTNETIKIEAPADAIPIQDVLSALGLGAAVPEPGDADDAALLSGASRL